MGMMDEVMGAASPAGPITQGLDSRNAMNAWDIWDQNPMKPALGYWPSMDSGILPVYII